MGRWGHHRVLDAVFEPALCNADVLVVRLVFCAALASTAPMEVGQGTGRWNLRRIVKAQGIFHRAFPGIKIKLHANAGQRKVLASPQERVCRLRGLRLLAPVLVAWNPDPAWLVAAVKRCCRRLQRGAADEARHDRHAARNSDDDAAQDGAKGRGPRAPHRERRRFLRLLQQILCLDLESC
jgi:hypothetical protein